MFRVWRIVDGSPRPDSLTKIRPTLDRQSMVIMIMIIKVIIDDHNDYDYHHDNDHRNNDNHNRSEERR